MKILLLSFLSFSFCFSEEIRINATVDTVELNACVLLVKAIDDLPILSVEQSQMNSKFEAVKENGDRFFIQINDPNTMIIMTGHVRGPLNGGGKHHNLKRTDGKWTIVSTGHWVS
jgi:hypothetical protein